MVRGLGLDLTNPVGTVGDVSVLRWYWVACARVWEGGVMSCLL